MALSTVFLSINSPDNSPLSHSVLPVLFLPYWSFQLYNYLFMKVSFSPDIIHCGWLGLKRKLTKLRGEVSVLGLRSLVVVVLISSRLLLFVLVVMIMMMMTMMMMMMIYLSACCKFHLKFLNACIVVQKWNFAAIADGNGCRFSFNTMVGFSVSVVVMFKRP